MKKKYGSFLFFSVVSNSGQVYLQATLTGYQTLCQYRHHLQGDFSQGISLESFLNVKMLQHSSVSLGSCKCNPEMELALTFFKKTES